MSVASMLRSTPIAQLSSLLTLRTMLARRSCPFSSFVGASTTRLGGAQCMWRDWRGLIPTGQVHVKLLSSHASHPGEHSKRRKLLSRLPRLPRLIMSAEEKERKRRRIEQMRVEKTPTGLVAKFKYYFKRYGYIFVPVHLSVCAVWFGALWVAVRSGVDVIHLLEAIHLPESWVEKVKSIPPAAGTLVLAAVVYKIATPLRYASSLLAFRLVFNALRRAGRLRTAHEVEFGVRSRYEEAWRKLNQRRVQAAGAKHARKNGTGKLKNGDSPTVKRSETV